MSWSGMYANQNECSTCLVNKRICKKKIIANSKWQMQINDKHWELKKQDQKESFCIDTKSLLVR